MATYLVSAASGMTTGKVCEMAVTDDLLSRLRAGDADAGRELLKKCQRLRSYFGGKLPDSYDADDCVNEVVARALDQLRKGAAPRELMPWLVGIAKNVLKAVYEDASVAAVPDAELTLHAKDLVGLPTDLTYLLRMDELWQTVGAALPGMNEGLSRLMCAHIRLTFDRGELVVGAKLASSIRRPRAQVDRQLNRGRKETHRSIQAVVVARTGRSDCSVLDRMLTEILGAKSNRAGRTLILDSKQSRTVTGHAKACSTCGQRARDAGEYARWALGPGLVASLRDGDRRDVAVSAFRHGMTGRHWTGPLERLRVVVAAQVQQMPGVEAVAEVAHLNPDLLRRMATAVVGAVAVTVTTAVVLVSDSGPVDLHAVAPPAASSGAGAESTSPKPFTAKQFKLSGTLQFHFPGLTESPSPDRAKEQGPVTHPAAPTPGRRWGYVRVSTEFNGARGIERAVVNEGTWGTWSADPDPAVKNRKPTLRHDGPGLYRLRLPAVGSAQGITHVSVSVGDPAAGEAAMSCGIRESHPDGADQLIVVGCHTETGEAKDVRFDLLFAVPAAGGATMATVRYDGAGADAADSTGGHPEVRRVGQGRYQVTLTGPAFDDTGYPQVTPHGQVPTRCQVADVQRTGTGAVLTITCAANVSGAPEVDSGWQLTYVRGGSLTGDPTVPGAYAQVSGTAPGLRIDRTRSFNGTGGTMAIRRQGTGRYDVGFRGIPRAAATLQITATGPEPGHCAARWRPDHTRPYDSWGTVYCTDAAGRPADRRFGVAVVRWPGAVPGPFPPVTPGPHPPGPKWGYSRVTTDGIPLGVEVQLDGAGRWSTWSHAVAPVDELWLPPATAVHQAPGRYLVRLPGIGSPVGIAQVTPLSPVADSCSIVDMAPDRTDELIIVSCYGPDGTAKDASFTLLFAEANGDAPGVLVRADPAGGMSLDSTGGRVRVSHTAPGRYEAILDDPRITGTGYVQVTPLGTSPVRCRPTGSTASGSLRITIQCDTIAVDPAPADTGWLLTSVNGTGPHQDPNAPTAYAAVDPAGPVIDPTHSYSSTGEIPTISLFRTGVYQLTYRTLSNDHQDGTVQLTATGPAPRHCTTAGWNTNAAILTITVNCYDPTGQPTASTFNLAHLRPPP